MWVVVSWESATTGINRTELSYETENIDGVRSGCAGKKQHAVTVWSWTAIFLLKKFNYLKLINLIHSLSDQGQIATLDNVHVAIVTAEADIGAALWHCHWTWKWF